MKLEELKNFFSEVIPNKVPKEKKKSIFPENLGKTS